MILGIEVNREFVFLIWWWQEMFAFLEKWSISTQPSGSNETSKSNAQEIIPTPSTVAQSFPSIVVLSTSSVPSHEIQRACSA